MSDLGLIASRLPGAQGTPAAAVTGIVSDPPRNFAALDNGTILRGTVQGRDKDGLTAVKTDQGILKIATSANLPAGSDITMEVRAIGDRLQVIVLAVNQATHAADPAAGAASAESASHSPVTAAAADGGAQASARQPPPTVGGAAASSAASLRQPSAAPTVIVAGTSLTAIVIRSVPPDLIQIATATLRQADDEKLSVVSPMPGADPSGARSASMADFHPAPPPPISASLMPAIHDRIAALFAEPLAEVEMIADAALAAVGGPAISADMRERIIALFVGEPANGPNATTIPPPVPSQAQQPEMSAPPGLPQSQSAGPSGGMPAGTPPVANPPEAAAGQPAPSVAPSPMQAGTPPNAVAADISLPPSASPAAVQVPATASQPAMPPPPLVTTTPSPFPIEPATPPQPLPTSPPTQRPDVPQPQQASQFPAATVSNNNPDNQAVAGSRLPPPIAPIAPAVLAQLLADAARTDDLGNLPWQVPGAAQSSAPQSSTPQSSAPQSSAPAPETAPPETGPQASVSQASVSQASLPPANISPLGASGLQAATLANLLVIIEQSSSATSPLTLSALNSTLQDPAVSTSPIAPVSISPLSITTNPGDANASAQSGAKPASTAAAALAALAESAAADAPIDPKAEGIALTAIVTSVGKAALSAAALGNGTSDGATPAAAATGTPASTVANGQVPASKAAANPAGGTAAGGAEAGGTALANASAEYLVTANAPTILAEDAAGLTALGGNGQLSGPLPTGTELRLRVVDIQQQPNLNAAMGSAEVNVATAGKATLVGQILGHTPAGHPVIHTSVGDLVLQQQASLPVGAKITLLLEAVEMAGANNLTMPTTPPMTALNVAQGWPTLFDLLATLQSGSAPAGLAAGFPGAPATGPDAGTLARLLQPGSNLAAGMAEAIDAFRSGDFEKLFGALGTALKAAGGKQDPVRKLRDEFGQLSTLAQDRSQQDWRCAFLPLWDDSRLQQINLFYRRPRRGESGKGKDDDATRFIVEVNFTRLGGCQLDGLIRKKHFDLMIRSHQELPLEAKRHITGLFAEARQLGNYAGDVSFQTAVRFPVSPLDDIAKDSPSITA